MMTETCQATPSLPLSLPKLELNDFRVSTTRLLEDVQRAVYFSPRVIVWALQSGQTIQDI